MARPESRMVRTSPVSAAQRNCIDPSLRSGRRVIQLQSPPANQRAYSVKLFSSHPRLLAPMRTLTLFAIVVLMSTVLAETVTAQTLPAPQAITDPKQIASKPNAQVEPRSLTIEKLYMTRQVGRPTWSPDGKSIAFISNMSGRNNLWIVPADGGWPV